MWLEAFADTDGNGVVDATYFYTNQMPVKANIFSHIVSRLRAGALEVYVWAPTLSMSDLAASDPNRLVQEMPNSDLVTSKRLSPFSLENRRKLVDIYRDLATYSPIDGVYFEDDLYLSEHEDFSPAAQAAYRERFGRELVSDVLTDPVLAQEWQEWKSQTLEDLTGEIMSAVKPHQAYARSARVINSRVIMDPLAERFYAQNYEGFLSKYDYTIVKAEHYARTSSPDMQSWLSELGQKAVQPEGAKDKLIFEILTYDEKQNRWFKASEIREWTGVLKKNQIRYFSYTPETLLDDEHWYFPNMSGGLFDAS